MLEKSDTSISDVLKRFNTSGLDVGLMVPTPTGMGKSIMDATASVRDYLRDTSFHDFERQPQGPDNKVVRRAYFVGENGLEETTVSLYRPNTKNGDPRIWFGKLTRYATPFNLLALIVHQSSIFVVNCSRSGILRSVNDPHSPLGQIAIEKRPAVATEVTELLGLIHEISKRGFIRTLRSGDTGIGMTLETLLGIAANAKRLPDFKGIEIKAKRLGTRSGSRATLFSQTPDWRLSPIGSAWNLLSTYGYERDGKLRLNHEINAKGANSIGFLLNIDRDRDWLKQCYQKKGSSSNTHVATWQLQTLRDRLMEKHPQTFWVGASCRGKADYEEFHYTQVQHTKQPKVHNFEALLEGGLISVDYLMSQKHPDRPVVRDHGYLFKIHPQDFDALFPPAEIHYFEA
jgi:hypothetical protein